MTPPTVKVEVQEKPPAASAGQKVENGLAIAGGFVLALYAITESLARLGIHFGPCVDGHGFPWGQLITGGILVMPKTLGRATSGRVWEGIAGLIPGRKKTEE